MKEPMFPILNDEIIRAIPWAAIDPHDKQAQRNHSQTLRRLAERGGLSVCEAVAVMNDRPYTDGKKTPTIMAEYRRILMLMLREFEMKRAAPQPHNPAGGDAP